MKKRDTDSAVFAPPPSLKAMLQDLKLHDHLCLIYESHNEWKKTAIPFIAIGLKNKEKCIYIGNTHTVTPVCCCTGREVHKQLKREGIDTKKAEASGQLTILDERETYIKKGSFDPDLSAVAQAGRMIKFLIRETNKALKEGYAALRVTIDMTWFLNGHQGSERLLEYESKLNKGYFTKYPCLGLCLYDRGKFDPEIIKGVILTHPYLIRGNHVYRNLYYIPFEKYLRQNRNELEVDFFLKNIKKEHRTLESLKNREEQYRRLFEESIEGIVLADIDTGIIIDCNKALLKLVEHERDEVIGKPQKILHPPENDIGNVSRTFEEHRTDKRGQTIETRVITKTGKLKDVEIKANITEIKGRKALQGIFRDITKRKKMEEALRASEENFRNSMDSSPLGIRIVTENGKTMYANKAMLDMYGYDSLDELNTIPVKERYTPESYIEHQERKGKRRRGEPVPSSYEISIVRKNGEVRHLSAFRREVIWNGKKEFQMVYQDITEQKLAEELLRAERERYKTLMEHLPIGIVHIDPEGNYLYINPKFTEIFGYTIEDIPTGREFFHKAYPDAEYRYKVIDGWVEIKETESKKYQEHVFTVQCKNGTQKVVRFIPVRIGKEENLIGFQDITTQKKAEKALKESERKYRDLFENSLEGIFQTTPGGRFLAVNPACASISGYDSPEEMMATITDVGKQLYVNPEDREKWKKLIKQQGVIENFEHQEYRKDGTIIWVSLSARAIKDEEGNIFYYAGNIEDITGRRLAEEKLKALFSELEKKNKKLHDAYEELKASEEMLIQSEKMASLGRLSAGIAHELKNPLSIILQGIAYIHSSVEDSGLIDACNRIKKSAIRADTIIQSLLNFSRQNPPFFGEADINILIDETLAMVEHQMNLHNIQVIRNYNYIPKARVDSNQIRQVFINILINATEAMQNGGTITITTTTGLAKGGKSYIEVTITDTGTGIPEKILKNIFDPFFTTKGGSGGMGLGLSVTKGIIDHHRGSISIKSKQGMGTTVTINLQCNPLEKEDSQ